jgi:hypothetical protein
LLGLGGTYDSINDPDVLIDGGKGAFPPDELKKRFDELMCEVGRRVYGGSVPGSLHEQASQSKRDKDGCVIG